MTMLAEQIAKLLLEIHAVTLNLNTPYRFPPESFPYLL